MAATSTVTLDYTLRDLYSENNEDDPNLVLIYYLPNFTYNPDGSLTKFVYGHEVQEGEKEGTPSIGERLYPQRTAFSAGQMPIVVLDFDSRHKGKEADDRMCQQVTDGQAPHHVDFHRTYSQLPREQQPSVTFANDLGGIHLDAGAQISVQIPTDCLSNLPHLINPETHYEILSKRGLALSALPTPRSEVIDTCLTNPDDPALLAHEVSRIINSIEKRQLPFVIKLPQSAGGCGVFPIATEAERSEVKTVLTARLGGMLNELNESNYHLYPCSIVLQDFIPGPSVGLTFFVSKTGHARFNACSGQLFDDHGYWCGATIAYKQQEHLRATFSPIMEKVAAFLHGKGYYGPAGVDIITDERSGEHLIIDLNVRVTGSFHLGPLRGHFTKRGLYEAAGIKSEFRCSRDVFEARLADDMRKGSLVVTGWSYEESSGLSHAAITVGARDPEELKEYLAHVKAVGAQPDGRVAFQGPLVPSLKAKW